MKGAGMGLNRAGGLLSALAALFIIATLASSVFASETGITKIEVEGLYSMDKSELLYLLDLAEGGAVEPDSLRRGIKRAFLKGLFEELSVTAMDDGTVRVKVKERDFIEDIGVRGNKYLSDRGVKSGFLLKEKMPMRYHRIERAESELRALYL